MPQLNITKQYEDGAILTEAMLDAMKSSLELWANTTQLDEDNFQVGAFTALKYTASSVDAAAIEANAVTTVKINDAAVTNAKLSTLNYIISSSSGAFSSTSSSLVDITNLSATITTTGRPVRLALIGVGDTSSYLYVQALTGVNAIAKFQWYRDSTPLGLDIIQNTGAGLTGAYCSNPASTLQYFDTPAAGTYTYKLQGQVAGGDTFQVNHASLIAYEVW